MSHTTRAIGITAATLAALMLTGCASASIPTAEESSEQAAETSAYTEALRARIDLEPGDGTVYAEAEQKFAPTFVVWQVAADHSRLTYTRYTCTGSVDATQTASVTTRGDGYQAVWDGDTPLTGTASGHYNLAITDDQLTPEASADATDVAIADTDSALTTYTAMCIDAGKTIADVITN